MNSTERLLTEAIQTYLQHKTQLGVPDPPEDLADADSKSFQHMHEQINDQFELKAVDLVCYEGVCRAFRKVHNYKYITDPLFTKAMMQEMASQGVLGKEQEKAIKILETIKEEMSDGEGWCEQDSGYHPDLAEIIAVSKPGQSPGSSEQE
jgi:predicted unusual protein kinase regulating ubiquinone biosynthesis (AarF/ABC1/UbiB family)